MLFRTELKYSPNTFTIDYNSKIFTIGSCFATEISDKLIERKFSVLHNPFGVLFHPYSIENSLIRIYSSEEYTESEIYKFDELFLSWDHHSSFNSTSSEEILNNINNRIKEAKEFLLNADVIFITLGTSFVYKLNQFELIVANCHKVPSSYFTKELLSIEEVKTSLISTIEMLKDLGKENLKIVFTVSPVRHIKDGIIENNLSKSILLYAVHEIIKNYKNCEYFPAYEFVLDDLRDYRFYKSDLIHPSEEAVNYIWEKFVTAYFDDSVLQIIKEVEKINSSLNHKTQHPDTIAYKKFIYGMVKKLEEIILKLPKDSYNQDLKKVRNIIKNFS